MKNKITLIIFSVALLLTNCEQSKRSDKFQIKKGMIKVTILYPNDNGKTFDMEYYANEHMPMLVNLFGDALKKVEIDKGVSGRTPNDPIPYLAIGYLYFENLLAYQNAFEPHAEKIRGDISNYTDIQPIVQISEVLQ